MHLTSVASFDNCGLHRSIIDNIDRNGQSNDENEQYRHNMTFRNKQVAQLRKERIKKSTCTVNEILEAIEAFDIDVAAVRTIRKPNKDRPRLLRVSFSSFIEKQVVINQSKI